MPVFGSVIAAARAAIRLLGFGWPHDREHGPEQLLRATFDRAGIGIGHLTADGRWLCASPPLCQLLGRALAALKESDFRVLLPEVSDFAGFIAPLLSGEREVLSLERAHRGAGGDEKYVHLKLSMTRPPAGGPGHVILVADDVTERRSTEARLQQAQQIESVGRLAGGVAHDLNNLLGVIMGNLELLGLKLDRDAAAQLHLNRALRATERASVLISHLLAFSRRQMLLPQRTDVNRLIDDVVTTLAPVLGDNVAVRTRLAPSLLPAMIDPGQLKAALVNLAVNARDAMGEGGVIEIATEPCYVDGSNLVDDLGHGEFVVVRVSDTGAGMTPEILSRVFEPFFTTKDVGKGTGLGLSMVHGFAKQSGGRVHIESTPGCGTAVRLYLPADVSVQAAVA
ncbi:MAG: nitrogen regulation protein NR(II) [Alphaproteobacteria bacterium]